jgi:hypothetical protein
MALFGRRRAADLDFERREALLERKRQEASR